MYFANFLHFYQPAMQKKEILDRVIRECYRPVLSGLLKIPQARLTINFSSCLSELLDRYGYKDLLLMVKKLLENGQIELTGSAKYHPLLPKMPEFEIIRQIKMDLETNKKYFGPAFKPRGFFPPEMAFDIRVAKIVSGLGFKWIIVDEYSYPGKCEWDKIYKIAPDNLCHPEFLSSRAKSRDPGPPAGGPHALRRIPPRAPLGRNDKLVCDDGNLFVFFREREISFKILSAQLGTAKMLIEELSSNVIARSEVTWQSRYLLTAMDGETFGHHRPGLEELLFEVFKADKFQTIRISDLETHFLEKEIKPLASTWALMEQDRQRKIPFGRWDDPDNEIHQFQWQLTNLAIQAASNLPENSGARQLLDRAVHSDQYWWASAKPWWSIEYIESGAKEFLEVIKSIPNISYDIIKQANDLYIKILTTAFDWQRTGRVAEMVAGSDEEIYQRTKEALTATKKEEIGKMITKLNEQMLNCASHQEYERAGQLRDRIKEVRGYLK